MNDMKVCGNHEALIGYVYDECEPAERASIAAHVALCVSCAEEIHALSDTRAHLGAWTPPALPLGFQITRSESETPASARGSADKPATVLRPAAWYRQPLPAWAQVAAAAVFFAGGMGVNVVRSPGGDARAPVVAQAPAPAPAAAPVVDTAPADDMRVTRDEFARLEARLRSIENADVQAASRTGRDMDQAELLARVNSLEHRNVENDRQMLGLISTVSRLAREAENQREATRAVNQMQADVNDLSYVVRTAVVPSLAVRTALTNGR